MVYVDPLMDCIPNPRWRWNQSCHLHTLPGQLDELHKFAMCLGLKRSWFQNNQSLPHYDLNVYKRRQAVSMGAREVTRQLMVEHMKLWKSSIKESFDSTDIDTQFRLLQRKEDMIRKRRID